MQTKRQKINKWAKINYLWEVQPYSSASCHMKSPLVTVGPCKSFKTPNQANWAKSILTKHRPGRLLPPELSFPPVLTTSCPFLPSGIPVGSFLSLDCCFGKPWRNLNAIVKSLKKRLVPHLRATSISGFSPSSFANFSQCLQLRLYTPAGNTIISILRNVPSLPVLGHQFSFF